MGEVLYLPPQIKVFVYPLFNEPTKAAFDLFSGIDTYRINSYAFSRLKLTCAGNAYLEKVKEKHFNFHSHRKGNSQLG